MAQTTPADLVLRCYGYKGSSFWVGHCIDLDIAVQAENIVELKSKMEQAISSYLETVLDTEDRDSIPALLKRRAPLFDHFKYHAISALMVIHSLRQKALTFNEALPFHLGRTCSC